MHNFKAYISILATLPSTAAVALSHRTSTTATSVASTATQHVSNRQSPPSAVDNWFPGCTRCHAKYYTYIAGCRYSHDCFTYCNCKLYEYKQVWLPHRQRTVLTLTQCERECSYTNCCSDAPALADATAAAASDVFEVTQFKDEHLKKREQDVFKIPTSVTPAAEHNDQSHVCSHSDQFFWVCYNNCF